MASCTIQVSSFEKSHNFLSIVCCNMSLKVLCSREGEGEGEERSSACCSEINGKLFSLTWSDIH